MASERYIRTGMATTVRQTILWTGVLAVIPLLAYPRTFGFGQFGFHPVFGLLEWALYFTVFLALLPAVSVGQRILAAGFTVVYRLTCALLFAYLAALNNNYGLADTIAIGMWSYPLALVPHVIAAPLVTKALWKVIFPEQPRRARLAGFQTRNLHGRRTSPVPAAVGALHAVRSAESIASLSVQADDSPSFDDAVTYVGGYTGVRMCWVVDGEGLPLAFWQRQDYTGAVEFWAPTAIEIVEFNRRCISVGGEVLPEHIEVRSGAGRLVVQTAGEYWICVLTDRDADDLVGVRLSQARDMVLKHLQERRAAYAGLQEAHYV